MKLSTLPTLDERWLAFTQEAAPLFAAHPRLTMIRQHVFKDFAEKKETLMPGERVKSWVRTLVKRQHSTGDLSPVDVLFWVEQPRDVHIDALLPVMQQVQALGLRARLVSSPEAYARVADVNPVRYQVPFRLGPTERWQRAWADLRALFPQDFAAESESAFLDMGQAADSCYEEIHWLLRQMRPKLVVMAIDQLLSTSALCVAARDLGIESLVLMHGAVLPYNVPITADHMGVWGDHSRDHLLALGALPTQLVTLGSPRHDHFPQPVTPGARQRLQQTLGLRPGKPLFMFFSNGNDPLRNSYEAVQGCADWVMQAAYALRDEMDVAVRLHPNEDGRFYSPVVNLRVFKDECDLATTLTGADVCGALCSTTLVDSLLYDRPVLQFYADGWPELADNWRRGLARRISSPDDLIRCLRGGEWRVLAEEQTGRIETVFANRGRAAEAVAVYIAGRVNTPSP